MKSINELIWDYENDNEDNSLGIDPPIQGIHSCCGGSSGGCSTEIKPILPPWGK